MIIAYNMNMIMNMMIPEGRSCEIPTLGSIVVALRVSVSSNSSGSGSEIADFLLNSEPDTGEGSISIVPSSSAGDRFSEALTLGIEMRFGNEARFLAISRSFDNDAGSRWPTPSSRTGTGRVGRAIVWNASVAAAIVKYFVKRILSVAVMYICEVY